MEAICAPIAVGGINTPFRHCRLHVKCDDCKDDGPFDFTVGLERNRKTGDLQVTETASYSGLMKEMNINDLDSCRFGKCVRKYAEFFKPLASGWKSQYRLTGPNSNTFVGWLVRQCGGPDADDGGPWLAPGWDSEFFRY